MCAYVSVFVHAGTHSHLGGRWHRHLKPSLQSNAGRMLMGCDGAVEASWRNNGLRLNSSRRRALLGVYEALGECVVGLGGGVGAEGEESECRLPSLVAACGPFSGSDAPHAPERGSSRPHSWAFVSFNCFILSEE